MSIVPASVVFIGVKKSPAFLQQFKWKEERFNEELRDVMMHALQDTLFFAGSREVSLRDAAFAIGIERVARASKMRGYV